jgi:hypothetical protein
VDSYIATSNASDDMYRKIKFMVEEWLTARFGDALCCRMLSLEQVKKKVQ